MALTGTSQTRRRPQTSVITHESRTGSWWELERNKVNRGILMASIQKLTGADELSYSGMEDKPCPPLPPASAVRCDDKTDAQMIETSQRPACTNHRQCSARQHFSSFGSFYMKKRQIKIATARAAIRKANTAAPNITPMTTATQENALIKTLSLLITYRYGGNALCSRCTRQQRHTRAPNSETKEPYHEDEKSLTCERLFVRQDQPLSTIQSRSFL